MPDESNSNDRRITKSRGKYVCECTSPEDDRRGTDHGYYTPYAEFLECEIETIEEILGQLILEHGEHKPIDGLIAEIEAWMGDDWYINLSDEDRKRLDEIKGWTYG